MKRRIVVEYSETEGQRIDRRAADLGVNTSQLLRVLVEVELDSERVAEVVEERKRVLAW